jgi:lipopolysaccharide export system protein LptA
VPLCGALTAQPPVPSRHFRVAALLGSTLALVVPGGLVHAEKADRYKEINIESAGPGQGDLIKQIVVFTGNVVVTKGTMTIRAARIEIRQTPDGYYTAVAFGSPDHHATFRQKRDAPDEWMEGDAEKLDYDGKSDVIRFVGDATVRHLRGSTTANELKGDVVKYDSTTEVFNVSGGGTATASNPNSRVRATLVPREGTAAASEAAAAAASAAASGAAPLRSEPALGIKK